MKTLLFLLLVPFLAFGQVQLTPQNHTRKKLLKAELMQGKVKCTKA